MNTVVIQKARPALGSLVTQHPTVKQIEQHLI